MLDRLLQIVGVDLEARLAQVTTQANAFKDTALRELQARLAYAAAVAGFALAAIFALAATCVIALIALYIWLEPQLGVLAALAVLGSTTGVVAIVMAALAFTRKPLPVTETTVPHVIVAAPRPDPPSADLTALVAPLPTDAALVDVVAHRVSSRAARAADDAIEVAEAAVAHGSRMQLVGALAATIMVGWIIGRRGGL